MARKPDPMRDMKAAVVAVVAAFCLLGGWFLLFRVLVPSILEAHFLGSVFVASAVAILGVAGLCFAAFAVFQRIGRWLK